MSRCGKCKERYYYHKKCQTDKIFSCAYFSMDFDCTLLIPYGAEDWSDHKGDCKSLQGGGIKGILFS